MLDWEKLLLKTRRSHLDSKEQASKEVADEVEHRTPWERDYDRILFSTPVRRLADKTQVFPLERNDSVRTRLTHSYEVSNLARSMGMYLAYHFPPTCKLPDAARTIPPILAAAGLAHDLGNPPFGHQGEKAIQRWFADKADELFKIKKNSSSAENDDVRQISEAMKQDFLKFEGNAQSLRLLTRLQTVTNDRGLNLTLATLAALMKYPTSSDATSEDNPAKKKHGYFQSERDVVKTIFEHTGLAVGVRHPLTWLMEACDDIAYSVLDVEDSIKKGLVSVSDLFAFLDESAKENEVIGRLVKFGRDTHGEMRKLKLSPTELNDSTAQRFRVNAIGVAVRSVLTAYEKQYESIISGGLGSDLVSLSDVGVLVSRLKEFALNHAYRHSSVLALELRGFNTLYQLMDMLWVGISKRKSYADPASRRSTPFANFAYSKISENYRRVFEGKAQGGGELPIRYKEAQLLTDMVAGMTDSYALDLCRELEAYRVGPSDSN
jgi:dGTPase